MFLAKYLDFKLNVIFTQYPYFHWSIILFFFCTPDNEPQRGCMRGCRCMHALPWPDTQLYCGWTAGYYCSIIRHNLKQDCVLHGCTFLLVGESGTLAAAVKTSICCVLDPGMLLNTEVLRCGHTCCCLVKSRNLSRKLFYISLFLPPNKKGQLWLCKNHNFFSCN